MRLQDFPRPKNDNRRGVHWSASVYHPAGEALNFWLSELQAMKIKWVKVLDDSGGSSLELCQRLLAADVMPIVRLYRIEPNPGHIGGREEDTLRAMIAAGVRYFETNNEPDLPLEWKDGKKPSNWLDIVVDNFIIDADKIIALGGLPALPAMGVGGTLSAINQIVRKGRADLFDRGAWVAIHNYTLNHPLDYPYDAVNQEGQPISQEEFDRLGAWAWEGRSRDTINGWRQSDKNPGDTLEDDSNCFLSFQLLDEKIQQALGHAVPIISTEGGPVVGWKEDRRYPRVNPQMHAERVVQIAEFMQGTREIHGRCTDSYFSLCHWLIANYRMGYLAPTWESNSWYTDWWNTDFGLGGELPVVAAMKALPDIPITFTNRVTLTGRVSRADTDAGLPDLAVRLLRDGQEVAAAMTGPDGAFRLADLAAGTYDLSIAPWGVVRRGVIVPATEPVGGVPPIIVRLTGGRSSVLTGAVLSAAGSPLANRQVLLARNGAAVGQVTTGADGAFRFAELPLGSYQLATPGITITGIALDGWQTRNIRLTGGQAQQYRYAVVQKRLLPASETANRRIFYGTVTDAAGAGLNGIKLQMAWQGAAAGTQFPTTTTGRDATRPAGSYEFLHSPGTFKLQVIQGDWSSDVADGLDTAKVPGREGQPITYEVNFRLQAVGLPAQVDGSVPGGAAGLQLTLTAADGAPRTTALAADGSFAFADLPAGTYSLALAGIGTVAENIGLEPGGLFKLLFPVQSRLSGHVQDAVDGLMAVLYAPAPWGWTRQAVLDAAGNFAIDHLPAGNYRLEIGGLTLSDLLLNGENELALATVDLNLGQRSVVRGRVAGGAGQPQADVLLTLRRAAVLVAQTRTDATGAYRFANLPAGSYTLEAVGLGQVAAFQLDGEREQVTDILWPVAGPRSVLQGRVLNAEGWAVAAVWVRLLKGDREVARTQTDAAGAFRFAELAGGVYALALAEGEPLVTGITLAEDATVTRDLILPPAPVKQIGHYLLLALPPEPSGPGAAEARLLLGLVSRYAARSTDRVSAGYSVADASRAARVTIIGGAVDTEADATLTAAGCQVTRLSGDAYALAVALDGLFAEV